MATVTAAAMPMTARNGMPATDSPVSATMTVTPAKTTADPDVALARAAASSAGSPSVRNDLCRDTMKSA